MHKLIDWEKRSRRMSFAIAMIWAEPNRDHVSDRFLTYSNKGNQPKTKTQS